MCFDCYYYGFVYLVGFVLLVLLRGAFAGCFFGYYVLLLDVTLRVCYLMLLVDWTVVLWLFAWVFILVCDLS